MWLTNVDISEQLDILIEFNLIRLDSNLQFVLDGLITLDQSGYICLSIVNHGD